MPWKRTSCALCANNCGLEVLVEDNRIAKVRSDRANHLSQGYVCRKGLSIAFNQHNADRVLHPMKRVGERFERVSWDQAISEIAQKLKAVLDDHGPRSLASLVSAQGCHYGIPFLARLVRMLGSRYSYSAANQEFAGRYWAHGLTLGSQALGFTQDYDNSDMLMAIGWNPLMSHGMRRSRTRLKQMSRDPDKLLVVIDPRLSETARIADIHLALRPGTDALLLRAMIAIILQGEMHNQSFVDRHVDGLAEILPWFAGFDAEAALKVCELDYERVHEVCRQFATRRSCLRDDLGILMGRHSAFLSYLLVVLLTICGRISVPGGNLLGGGRVYSDPEDPKTWRTLATDIPAINEMFPPNVMAEEILSDHPQRLRAVLAFGSNPLRSYADTTAWEEAFARLDLLVVTEMAMSETAALAHYVLPSRSSLESWDGMPGGAGFPEVYRQIRPPVVVPEGEQREAGDIFTDLADAMSLLPQLPDYLYRAAEGGNLRQYRDALLAYVGDHPESARTLPYIAAKTLGRAIGSAHLASLFVQLIRMPRGAQDEAARAGFAPGPDQGLEIYKALTEHPEGVLAGIRDPYKGLDGLPTSNGRIQLYSPAVEDWIRQITPAAEERRLQMDRRFPLILNAGRHMDMNANTNMRDPAWNEGRRPCTLAMNPADAGEMGLADGQMARVITEAGEELVEVEVTTAARKGHVIIPHGFGLIYDGVKYGANVNRLTKNTHRDQFGTPIHRYVPCRVEAC